MGCSSLKVLNICVMILVLFNVASTLYYNISFVKEGNLDAFIYGKDFKNKPCGLMDGKQQFKLSLPFIPKAIFSYAKNMSFCVSQCPKWVKNTTELLIEGGYGHLFEFHSNVTSKFLCGTIPNSNGFYRLQGGRCKKEFEDSYVQRYTYSYKNNETTEELPTECLAAPEDSKLYQIVEQLVVILTASWRTVSCISFIAFINVALVCGIFLFNGSKVKMAAVVTSLTISMIASLRFMSEHVPADAYWDCLYALRDSVKKWRISERFRLNTNECNALAAFSWLMFNFFWVFVSAVYVKKQSLVAETDSKINKMVVATPKLLLSLMLTLVLMPLSAALPLFMLIRPLQENYDFGFNYNASGKSWFFYYYLLYNLLTAIILTSCVRTFHKKLIAGYLYSELKKTSQILSRKETDEPCFLALIASVFQRVFLFPFCVAFELLSILPRKKMGLKSADVPSWLRTARVGSDVIIPHALFGDDVFLSHSALDRCVEFNRKLARKDNVQRCIYYALLKVCVPILSATSSAFAISFFATTTPGITGDNPLFRDFTRFELLIAVVAACFVTSHAVDVVRTAHLCSVYCAMAASEEKRKKLVNIEPKPEIFLLFAEKSVVESKLKGSIKRLVEYFKNYFRSEENVDSNPIMKV